MPQEKLKGFKAYDIRGRIPDDMNEDMAYRIGRAYALEIAPAGPVVIGRDVRETSESLAGAVMQGLNDAGVNTRDIGMCGTELVYFGAGRQGIGGGIMITASHNPIDYNGMKLVREGAIPISGDSGLNAIERRVREHDIGTPAQTKGSNRTEDITVDYVQTLLSFIDVTTLKPLKIVANAGNGNAGPFFDEVVKNLPFEVVRVCHEPDGSFPNGIPNPLLEENQPVTSEAVRHNKADIGLAWDGDFDRCFFFDENGEFVSGYYIVGLFAEHVLKNNPGEKVIHDPRMTWNTIEMVKEAGGIPVQSKTGHAFIKERMRAENAIYGGEMSAHHYFRRFAYCDSGMIPWLLMTSIMSTSGKPVSELVNERRQRYPSSGEINRRVEEPQAVIEKVRSTFAPESTSEENVDGLSMEFGAQWRFNIRMSQTEPILRLNVEAKEDESLMREKTDRILELIGGTA